MSIEPPSSPLRARVTALVEGPRFVKFIIALILLNALTLGLETNDYLRAQYSGVLHSIDRVILGVFVVEVGLRFFAFRFSFFKSGWNIFDLLIVGISLLPTSGPLAILRVFRVFRVMRLISVVPQMRNVIAALLGAVPGMASIVAVLMIVFYVSAVLATQAFGTHSDPQMQHLFGSFGASMYSLFQVMTLEGWADGVVNPTLEFFPWALWFFIPFIVLTSFAVLNLFIGVIVDSMESIRAAPHDKIEAQILRELQSLRQDIEDIKTGRKE